MNILLATSNAHKLEELSALFADMPAVSFSLPPEPLEVEETGSTFQENARLKACAYAKAFDAPCLADDSGLAVDALGGRPGIHSARYAPSDAERIAKLLSEMAEVPSDNRSAAFVCAMTLAYPDGRLVEVEGRCPGVIADAPRGTGGFGYDPVFLLPELGRTYGELSADEKNRLSHRARAAADLRQRLIP